MLKNAFRDTIHTLKTPLHTSVLHSILGLHFQGKKKQTPLQKKKKKVFWGRDTGYSYDEECIRNWNSLWNNTTVIQKLITRIVLQKQMGRKVLQPWGRGRNQRGNGDYKTKLTHYKLKPWTTNEQLNLHSLTEESWKKIFLILENIIVPFFFFVFLFGYKELWEPAHYSLCFTRLPLTSLPSRIASFPCLHAMTECSLTLATYSKSSVRTEGQLSFKYSKPSVCITAGEKKPKGIRNNHWNTM